MRIVTLPTLIVMVLTGCGDAPQGNHNYSDSKPTIDGYVYETVKIGKQEWFAENLKTSVYRNGDTIPADLSRSQWMSTNGGASAIYEGEVLYNWYAVNDVRCLCPSGWHVPTDREWLVMTDILGGESVAGNKMKTTFGWENQGNGTNSSGFSGLPAGFQSADGYSVQAGKSGFWWSSTPGSTAFGSTGLKDAFGVLIQSPPDNYDDANGWFRILSPGSEKVYRHFSYLRAGYSVRCVKDAE